MSTRTNEPELIDGDSLSDAERLEALGQLPRLNRWLGGSRAVLKELPAVCQRHVNDDEPLRVLDVGCGVGDIPQAILRWAAASSRPATVLGMDRDAATLRHAAARMATTARIELLRGDGLRLPFADRSFHVVTSSMFCHHFYGDQLSQLLREMTRVADDAVIINDLHRHWAALWGYRVFSRVFLHGHVVRYDGDVSVRRGFVPDELRQLGESSPGFRWTVKRRLIFRLCLVGRRQSRNE